MTEFNYYSRGLRGGLNPHSGYMGIYPHPKFFFYDTKVEMQDGCIELLFYSHGQVSG